MNFCATEKNGGHTVPSPPGISGAPSTRSNVFGNNLACLGSYLFPRAFGGNLILSIGFPRVHDFVTRISGCRKGFGLGFDSAASQSADVLIIGADIAGLAAAAQLSRSGLRVAIIEARDRIGGRVFSRRDPAAFLAD